MALANCRIDGREGEGRKDGRGAPAPEGTPGAFLFAMRGELQQDSEGGCGGTEVRNENCDIARGSPENCMFICFYTLIRMICMLRM